ncbi:MAG TPA: hypothetical protein VF156_14385, partial [Agromyces sp.]
MPLRERESERVLGTGAEDAPDAPVALAERVESAVQRVPAVVAAAWHRLLATSAGRESEVRELVELVAAAGGGGKRLRARLAVAAHLGMGG